MENVIEAMRGPDIYPHEIKEPIQEIITHISHVFLTGKYAYKLKRPVNLGFLDFHTVDQRKYFCFEELRLNKRLSKELYLEVLPIYLSPEKGYILGETEEKLEPIDWALKMNQFPQENLFSNLIEEDKLEKAQLESLGKTLAQFHLNSATDEEISHFGEPDKYLEVISQNEDTTRVYVGKYISPKDYEDIFKFQKKFVEDNRAYFKERQAHEKIRECHGDLHLDNVVLFQGASLPFDCIEFNKSFKFIDCFYDSAFLFMDLLKNGRKDLAFSFLNSYLENTGDYYGAVLLNFFTSLRAYVRGKVCLFKLESLPEEEKLTEGAKKFFQLASDCTIAKTGKILCFSGVSGSGKSTIAKKLSDLVGALHIRSDVIRKHLGGVPLDQKGPDSLYSEDMTRKTYNVLIKKALVLSQQGLNVFLDAKFDQKEIRDELILHCKERGLSLGLIKCSAPMEVLIQRLQERVGDVSDAGESLLKSQMENFEEIEKSEASLELDTSSKQHMECALEFWKNL
jgi:aminoglycoside phosphotransferase family enzyme/gluconate kinase